MNIYIRKVTDMNVTIIHEDEHTVVKKVDYMGDFLYTVTYKKNDDGEVIKKITVFVDGTVDIQ